MKEILGGLPGNAVIPGHLLVEASYLSSSSSVTELRKEPSLALGQSDLLDYKSSTLVPPSWSRYTGRERWKEGEGQNAPLETGKVENYSRWTKYRFA